VCIFVSSQTIRHHFQFHKTFSLFHNAFTIEICYPNSSNVQNIYALSISNLISCLHGNDSATDCVYIGVLVSYCVVVKYSSNTLQGNCIVSFWLLVYGTFHIEIVFIAPKTHFYHFLVLKSSTLAFLLCH
jgi:hypothetical protein